MLKTKIKAKTGLHARPASLIVSAATEFQADIFLVKDNIEYNCKSIMAIMGSGLAFGDEIEIRGQGDDEEEAEQKIYEIIEGLKA